MGKLKDLLRSCELCPRRCRVNRLAGETGFCGVAGRPVISSLGPHFGEEPPLVGVGGSGTIFFTGCNLGCVFCQNHDISHGREGRVVTESDLADAMLSLQSLGCHNVNWVTPTHQTPFIFAALDIARARGLTVPTVFNCGGYESVEVLRRFAGRVEIYMPDAKFFTAETAARYADAPDYPAVMTAALKEMHRQVGDLEIRDGLAVRGLLIRHLVMPGLVDESLAILDFIAKEISRDTFVNVMDQYRPSYRAHEFSEIGRRVRSDEYLAVLRHAQECGLRTGV
jgi:putative pyruvate formate lyase activating enzyme